MLKRIAIEVFVALVIGAVFGVFGPFGTYAAPIGLRILYWAIFILAGYMLFRPTLIVSTWLADHVGMSKLLAKALALVFASMPMTLLIAWMLDGFKILTALTSNTLPYLYGQVLLISLILNFLYGVLFIKRGMAQASRTHVLEPVDEPLNSSTDASTEPALNARLPIGFGPILALQGEDHYVRAHGNTRSELILVRLRDAIAEMESVEGLQVHRSWWVSRTAVTRIERSGRTYALTLKNGLTVTASRDGKCLLETEGWT